MNRQTTIYALRLALASVGIVAVIFQFLDTSQKATFNPVNFFSFYTIESNIFAIFVLLLSAYMLQRNRIVSWLSWLRGAATTYMITTGIIYVLFLSGSEAALQTTLPWANLILHYVMPFAMLIDWLVDPPKKNVHTNAIIWWLLFPLAYVFYSLIRGQMTGWYPYPFLDVAKHGYGTVAFYSVGIALAIVIIAWSIFRLGRSQEKRTI